MTIETTIPSDALRVATRLRVDAAGHSVRVFFERRPADGGIPTGTWWATCPAWGDHHVALRPFCLPTDTTAVGEYASSLWPYSLVLVESPETT